MQFFGDKQRASGVRLALVSNVGSIRKNDSMVGVVSRIAWARSKARARAVCVCALHAAL